MQAALEGGVGDGAGDGTGGGAGVEDGAGEGIGGAVGDGAGAPHHVVPSTTPQYSRDTGTQTASLQMHGRCGNMPEQASHDMAGAAVVGAPLVDIVVGPAVDDDRVGGCSLLVVMGVVDDVAGDGSVSLGAEVVGGACVGGAVGRAVGAAVGDGPGRPPLTVQWGDGQLLAGWPGHQAVNVGSLHQALREQSVW